MGWDKNDDILAKKKELEDLNGKISLKNLKSAYEDSWKLTQEKALAYEKYK